MRKIITLLAAMLLVACMAFGVCANDISASEVRSFSTLSSDGGCQVSMTVTLDVRTAGQDLYFPVPKEASNVTLNGSWVRAGLDGDVRKISLKRIVGNMTGTMTVSINYSLRDVIRTAQSGNLEMYLPMLAGFDHPVEKMEFSVTFPGEISTLPAFQSGYHQASIEKDIIYEVSGAAITGKCVKQLKDHETLAMTLVVSEEMFPRTIINVQSYDAVLIAMGICAALALLYWIIALRGFFPLPQRSNLPPEGSNAGQLGSILCLQGADLSLTAISWAQLGYLTIRQERSGRVKLIKRMDMGNERSLWEQQVFRRLFGKLGTIDTAGHHYAALSRELAEKPMGMGELLKKTTGNLRLFRGLVALMGMFGGVCLAIAISGGAVLQGLLILILAALGTLSAWACQSYLADLLLGRREGLYRALIIFGAWLLVSLLAEAFPVGLWTVIGFAVFGVLYAAGGRRTPEGRQAMAQVLGLRWHLAMGDKQLFARLQDLDPGFAMDTMPWALALGVDKAFAARLGRGKIGVCSYVVREQNTELSAAGWSALLRQIKKNMDRRSRLLPMERAIDFVRRVIAR